jgi:APA family basic amino acid/polyamine antiporter
VGRFGWSGIVRGAAVVFFAYIGFDAVSTAA